MPFAVPFFIAVLLTVFASPADELGNPPGSWVTEAAKGHFPYHKLTASDFPIDHSAHPEFGMHTRGCFQFHYHDKSTEHNGRYVARITDWIVWSGFDRNKSSRKSWFKKVTETLPHEQGHLDLSELHSKALADTSIDKLPVGEGATAKEAEADLQRKMTAFSHRVSAENQTEQDRYDGETDHGRNTAKQQKWSAAIHDRLQRAGIHF